MPKYLYLRGQDSFGDLFVSVVHNDRELRLQYHRGWSKWENVPATMFQTLRLQVERARLKDIGQRRRRTKVRLHSVRRSGHAQLADEVLHTTLGCSTDRPSVPCQASFFVQQLDRIVEFGFAVRLSNLPDGYMERVQEHLEFQSDPNVETVHPGLHFVDLDRDLC
jgi:hypothetical protein